jgi:hypothetical protein
LGTLGIPPSGVSEPPVGRILISGIPPSGVSEPPDTPPVGRILISEETFLKYIRYANLFIETYNSYMYLIKYSS